MIGGEIKKLENERYCDFCLEYAIVYESTKTKKSICMNCVLEVAHFSKPKYEARIRGLDSTMSVYYPNNRY